MLENDEAATDTERLSSLDVFQFSEFQCFAAQDSTQPCPTANAHNEAEIEQALSEQEHEGNNEEDRWNRSKRRIEVLHAIINPTPK